MLWLVDNSFVTYRVVKLRPEMFTFDRATSWQHSQRDGPGVLRSLANPSMTHHKCWLTQLLVHWTLTTGTALQTPCVEGLPTELVRNMVDGLSALQTKLWNHRIWCMEKCMQIKSIQLTAIPSLHACILHNNKKQCLYNVLRTFVHKWNKYTHTPGVSSKLRTFVYTSLWDLLKVWSIVPTIMLTFHNTRSLKGGTLSMPKRPPACREYYVLGRANEFVQRGPPSLTTLRIRRYIEVQGS